MDPDDGTDANRSQQRVRDNEGADHRKHRPSSHEIAHHTKLHWPRDAAGAAVEIINLFLLM
jgi:hypothetical protein